MVQINRSSKWSTDPGFALGLLAYAMAGISLLVQTHLRLGYTNLESFIVPALPWMFCVILLVAYRTRPLLHYWWVLPTIVIANPHVLLIVLMMVAWSIGGFV